MSQQALTQVLRQLPGFADPLVLVGSGTGDDAGVYRLDRDRALVQTVDFFTPVVDDPVSYGQIAAANALSDVYAMGGRPLTALNIMGMPTDLVATRAIAAILRGGAAKAKEAGCAIVGGHTIRNPEPIYGMAVTGLVSPRRMITNAAAKPGDLLVLTKPLGTGIITTGIKRGVTSSALARRAIRSMRQLNSVGAELAERQLVRAGTDVTGFGLLGHLGALCLASGTGAEIDPMSLPILGKEVFALIEQECVPGGSRQNLETANRITDWGNATNAQKILLTDAQTSGGLLLCVAKKRMDPVLELLRVRGALSTSIVGSIIASSRARIQVRA